MGIERLNSQGISLEVVQHNNGSPGHGMYWGYVVAQSSGDGRVIYHGKTRKTDTKSIQDAFPTRRKALQFAQSLQNVVDELRF